jgi:hypothetical protein
MHEWGRTYSRIRGSFVVGQAAGSARPQGRPWYNDLMTDASSHLTEQRVVDAPGAVPDPVRRPWRLALVVLVAALLHAWAVVLLPVDFDEPIYVGAALDYADALRARDLGAVVNYAGNREHPALVKLLYAGGALVLGERADPTTTLYAARTISAVFGVLAVATIGWFFGPLAGGLLAIHTLVVKYTSQAYLEALPLWLIILAFGLLTRGQKSEVRSQKSEASGRYFFAALAYGAAAAAKLTYPIIAAPALAYLLIVTQRRSWRQILGFGAIAVLTFLLLNPTLWNDPLDRFLAMGGFYASYTQGADVAARAYPWYQPLIWIGSSPAADWHQAIYFYFGFDGLIFLFALAGARIVWRDRTQHWLLVWLFSGLLLLMLWPTRWPQYALTIVPAVCILAATALRRLIAYLRDLDDYWGWALEMLPNPPRYAKLFAGLTIVFIGAIYAYGLIGVAVGGIGWSRLTAADHPLLATPVHAVLPLTDGRVALATDRGLLLWRAPMVAGEPPNWQQVGNERSLALAEDDAGRLLVGTASGLLTFTPDGERSESSSDLGTGSAQVHALALGSDGRLWVGTEGGAAVRPADQATWTPLPEANAGRPVYAVAVESQPAGDVIWFGGIGQVSRYDTVTQAWKHFGREAGFGNAGVSAILIDTQGALWFATLGNGLGHWDGITWTWRTPATDGLPRASLTALAEPQPGVLWVGLAEPIAAGGGLLASLENDQWQLYLPRNSGFPGAEPLAIVRDATQRLWIGTRSDGVVLYQLPQ